MAFRKAGRKPPFATRLPGIGTRILDHGIAGAFLLLLHSITYFQIHFAQTLVHSTNTPLITSSNPHDQPLDKFVERTTDQIYVYKPRWWWTNIVWATATVTIHNVQTMDFSTRDSVSSPLAISEDPLAYLGILVDLLQEWDRYTTRKTSIFTGKLPLSSNSVQLGIHNGVHSPQLRRSKRRRTNQNPKKSSIKH